MPGRPSPVIARQRLLRHHEVEPLGADVFVHVVPGCVGVVPGTADARHVPGVEHLLAVNDLARDAEPLHDEREGRRVARADRLAKGEGAQRRARHGVEDVGLHHVVVVGNVVLQPVIHVQRLVILAGSGVNLCDKRGDGGVEVGLVGRKRRIVDAVAHLEGDGLFSKCRVVDGQRVSRPGCRVQVFEGCLKVLGADMGFRDVHTVEVTSGERLIQHLQRRQESLGVLGAIGVGDARHACRGSRISSVRHGRRRGLRAVLGVLRPKRTPKDRARGPGRGGPAHQARASSESKPGDKVAA